jgi:tRNA (mo5U34)-methyltransferase
MESIDQGMQTQNMKKLLDELGPWHFDFEIVDGLRTNISTNREKLSFRDPKNQWRTIISETGIDISKAKMLDCGCNSGAMCFFAARDGFDECVGIDAHKHWIDQAEFVRGFQNEEIQNKTTFMNKRIQDYKSDLEFDLVLFNGLFYHLPDPIHTLEKVTKLIKPNGWITINTVMGQDNRGSLKVKTEGVLPMSGVDGLSIIPDGPDVLITILKWLGFDNYKTTLLREDRIEILARKNS